MSSVLIRNIAQKDNYHFTIEWSDGVVQCYRLSNLQKECCCAHCMDEATGKRVLDPQSVLEDVKATKIQSMGRYALRIYFTSGCSSGIYTFDLLRQLGEA